MALSLTSVAFSLFITEYFFGLELLRPFLLWMLLPAAGASPFKKLRSVILRWLPYLAILIPFVVWRAFIAPSPRVPPSCFSASCGRRR